MWLDPWRRRRKQKALQMRCGKENKRWWRGRYVPAVRDGDDAGAVLGDLEEHGHGEVEVGPGRVAPAAIVGGESVVGRAEVGGGDEDGGAAVVAPLGVVGALDLEAGPAAQPVVEERRAQRRRLHAVPLAV